MNEQDLLDLISLGKEGRNLEYKKSMPWDSAEFKAKITKSVLAMANLRDGGVIVIGMNENPPGHFTDEGMKDEDYDTYTEDILSEHFSKYADPFVEISIRKIEREDDGKKFVFILVKEFEEIPVICKKDGPTGSGLFKGRMYCRSRRKYETVEVPSQTEMREIIELATEKMLRKYLRAMPIEEIKRQPADSQLFEKQLEDFEQMDDELLKKIKSRGYWKIIIRPSKFKKDLIESLGKCDKIIQDSIVGLRGWDYPHYPSEGTTTGLDYIEGRVDWQEFLEVWRFYQSGQFVHFIGLREDWWEDDKRAHLEVVGPSLSILGALYTLTEIYVFASRLTKLMELNEPIVVSISLVNTEGRKLVTLDPARFLRGDYVAQINEISIEKTHPITKLLTAHAELALEDTTWIFERFNWKNPPKDVFKEDQRKFLERRI
jgi:hypothetical protein